MSPPLQVGDVITQVEFVDEQWILGDVGGKRGIVPKNYISLLWWGKREILKTRNTFFFFFEFFWRLKMYGVPVFQHFPKTFQAVFNLKKAACSVFIGIFGKVDIVTLTGWTFCRQSKSDLTLCVFKCLTPWTISHLDWIWLVTPLTGFCPIFLQKKTTFKAPTASNASPCIRFKA